MVSLAEVIGLTADGTDRIWEGTTTVMALDLVRSAQDPSTFAAFISVSVSLTIRSNHS